ncbi:MAG TPA: hypothetical protein VK988_22515, partial [Acidimicrobiales bacterium]|nr:hypothetical protein [Acidimicrobiales bacterium]
MLGTSEMTDSVASIIPTTNGEGVFMIRRCTTRRLAVLGSMTLVASLGFVGSSSAAPSKANFKSFTGS